MDSACVDQDTRRPDERRELDRRSVLRGVVVGAGVGGITGDNAFAQPTGEAEGDETRLASVGSTDSTSPGNSRDGFDSPGTIVVGGALILVTILYALFRPTADQPSAQVSGGGVVWDNPKFTDHMEIAREQLESGTYERAISAVQTAIQTADSAKARAEQRDDDTDTIERALVAARDLKEEILSERDRYEAAVANLGQIDEELKDLREGVETTTASQPTDSGDGENSPPAEALLKELGDTTSRLDRTTQTLSEQEFDDLVIERDRLQETATELRERLLTSLVRSAPTTEVTASTDDVEITKRLSAADTSAPAVVYEIDVAQTEPKAIRLTDTLPESVDTADVVFSDEDGGECWRVADDGEILFEREVDGQDTVRTAYEIHSTDVTDVTDYLTRPDLT